MAISKKWNSPKKQYFKWYKSGQEFVLGNVQFVLIEEHLWMANLIGQENIEINYEKTSPVRFEAITEGLNKV